MKQQTRARSRRGTALLIGLLSVAAVDQATKWGASRLDASAHVVPVHNPGLSLQIVDTARWTEVCAMVAALVAATALLGSRVLDGRLSSMGVAMTLGGAASNLLDRALLGWVRDFLVVGPVVINVADLAVVIGLAIIVRQRHGNASGRHPRRLLGQQRCRHDRMRAA